MKSLLISIISLFLVCCETKNKFESPATLKHSSARSSLDQEDMFKYYAELGIPKEFSQREAWLSSLNDGVKNSRDTKFKLFIKKYEKSNDEVAHTTIDIITRTQLKNLGLFDSTQIVNEADIKHNSLAFLKNGGQDIETLYGILSKFQDFQFFPKQSFHKLTWYLNTSIETRISEMENNIKAHETQINQTNDSHLKALYEPDNAIMHSKISTYKAIQKKIAKWPQEPIRNKQEFDAIFN